MQGGMGLIDIASKRDALFVTQPRMLNSVHHFHDNYWVGIGLRVYMPELR